MDQPINLIDQAIPVIAQAVTEWQQKNSAEVLRTRVHKMLDDSSKEVTMKLLGFENNWGKWELDHCNGRSGESAAGDYLRRIQQAAIEEWLGTIQMPPLSESIQDSLQKELLTRYKSELIRRVRQLAEQQAEADAQDLVASLTQSAQIKNYLAAMQLITSTGESNAS